ncbi:MAG TPA: hypothetical protein VL625_10825, partial [Patescibacteria group bacterium]|nr:hypothetical protein [Patescibacteria group bacterium]
MGGYMTPDQIAAAKKQLEDKQAAERKMRDDALLAKRLAEEKQQASPEAKAERAAEDKQDMALLMLPLEFAGLG